MPRPCYIIVRETKVSDSFSTVEPLAKFRSRRAFRAYLASYSAQFAYSDRYKVSGKVSRDDTFIKRVLAPYLRKTL